MRYLNTTRVIVAMAVVAVIVPVTIRARQAASDSQARVTFEVASVKPSDPGAPPGRSFAGIASAGGRFQSVNATLRGLIRYAYLVLPGTRLENVPSWFDTVHFDINAKAARDPPRVGSLYQPNAYQLMLQSLLADRFGLVLHRESRQIDAYALVLSRADGKLGSGLVVD